MNDKNDERLIQLFLSRDESAISETEKRYRAFAYSVLSPFLLLKEDREECFNDALLALWNRIPPEKPKSLSALLAKILRNIAISRTRAENAWKRGGRAEQAGEELISDITDGRTLAEDYESTVAGRLISEFLHSLPAQERQMFILRYWMGEDNDRIAQRMGKSSGAVRIKMKRLRDRLGKMLIKEGIIHDIDNDK